MRKILVIDDEPDFCFFVKENLELTGNYTVITAFTGEEGIASALKERPDLILLDLLMPKVDGAKVYRELDAHEATTSIPVIMLTAIDPESAREQVPGLPKEAFLTKPVLLAVLKAAIEHALKKR